MRPLIYYIYTKNSLSSVRLAQDIFIVNKMQPSLRFWIEIFKFLPIFFVSLRFTTETHETQIYRNLIHCTVVFNLVFKCTKRTHNLYTGAYSKVYMYLTTGW